MPHPSIPPQNSTNSSEDFVTATDSAESKPDEPVSVSVIEVAHRGTKEATAGVSIGVIVAVLAVITLVMLVVVGVLKEHKLIKFQSWRFLQAGERETTIGVEPSGTITQTEAEKAKKKTRRRKKMSPKKKLQSLLGPSHLGFSRLKTYDSNSEDEEFPVFNRV